MQASSFRRPAQGSGHPQQAGTENQHTHANENASECTCWLRSPVRDSFTLQFPIVLGEFLLDPGGVGSF